MDQVGHLFLVFQKTLAIQENQWYQWLQIVQSNLVDQEIREFPGFQRAPLVLIVL